MKRIIYVALLLLLSKSAFCQSKEQLRDSLTAITTQLKAHPTSIDLLLKKAGYSMQLENWQYAIDAYSDILKQQPSNQTALYFRAYLYDKTNRLNLSRTDYEALLKANPNHFEGRLGLALLNNKINRTTEAMDILNQLIEAYPDSAITYAIRASFEEEKQQYELAEYDFAEAEKRAPSNIDYSLGRVEMLINQEKYTEALEHLNILSNRKVPRVKLEYYYRLCANHNKKKKK